MSYYVSLEQSLFKSVREALKTIGHPNVEVRYADANTLEPSNTYCVLNILSVGQVGVEVASFKGREEDPLWLGDFTTPATYSALVQISVLGRDSLVVAPKLKSAVTNNRVVLDEFRGNGLGTTTRGDLRNIPQNRESGFVQMMNFDMGITFSHMEVQEAEVVRNVGISGIGQHSKTTDYYNPDPLEE